MAAIATRLTAAATPPLLERHLHTSDLMPRRNSPNTIADLSELSRLGDFVFDKRQGQRASAKKHRRNRHYEKQFIRNTLAHPPSVDRSTSTDDGPLEPNDQP